MKQLTATWEDYLRAIYCLGEKHDLVRSVDLTKYLNLARSTVSERLKELERDNLIQHDRIQGITLTDKGSAAAEKLTYKHRLIEVFLHRILKVDPAKVHQEAHKLEHAFSDEIIEKLADFLGNPQEDPHGQTIPKI